jgi:dienelactone hydrolase
MSSRWRSSSFGQMSTTRGLLLTLALFTGLPIRGAGQRSGAPDTVIVHNGAVALHALLWRPPGRGPYPAVFFNHGSGNTAERQAAQAATMGAAFSSHGYLFLFLYRRGSGLSADQGTSAVERLGRELASHGQAARNALQIRILEGDAMSDASAGLAFLRALPEVDRRRVVLAGQSFGASLTLLMAEGDTGSRAAVVFSGSAASWDRSPELRARLLAAVGRTRVPIFFIQAENDYSVAPTRVLSAEMARLGKRYRARIYPPVGTTAEDGHDFAFRSVKTWEPDVFAFLAEVLRR